ncbi:MAG: fluoride efflux transporter FluC, partial [Nocardioides sp.]
LGGGGGAPLRYLTGRHYDQRWPLGTLSVNVAGSFLLGACTAWSLDGATFALIGAGLCGGLTTYSTFAVQTADRLSSRHSLRVGAGYAAVTIVGSLAACAAGFAIAA